MYNWKRRQNRSKQFLEVIGRHRKGEMNTSDRKLAEMIISQYCVWTQKSSQYHLTGTTKGKSVKNGEDRKMKNPYRNQIDYVMLEKDHRIFLEDAKAYSGVETPIAQKSVKARLHFQWYELNPGQNALSLCIWKKFENNYHETLKLVNNKTVHEKWTNVVNVCTEAAEQVIGRKTPGKRVKKES